MRQRNDFSNGATQLSLIHWKCPACNRSAMVPVNASNIHCSCGHKQPSLEAGLGDILAATLHNVGITKRRYNRLRKAVGLKKPCRCRERQKRLNEIGRRVGIG